MARTSTSSDKSSSRSSGTRSGKEMDAYALLEEDHKRVQKLFKEFEKADREDLEAMRRLVETACDELEIHAALEEELFYPMLSAALEEDDQELVAEAHVEHDSAKQLIEQLRSLQPGDPMYAATFTVLGEYVNHHIEEERKEIFKQAKRAKIDADELGEQLAQRKQEMQEGSRGSGDGEPQRARRGSADDEVSAEAMDREQEPERTRGGGRR
jgi:hemerythrin-like domain-containing protein